jgi:hypothetical protein
MGNALAGYQKSVAKEINSMGFRNLPMTALTRFVLPVGVSRVVAVSPAAKVLQPEFLRTPRRSLDSGNFPVTNSQKITHAFDIDRRVHSFHYIKDGTKSRESRMAPVPISDNEINRANWEEFPCDPSWWLSIISIYRKKNWFFGKKRNRGRKRNVGNTGFFSPLNIANSHSCFHSG